MQTPTLTAFLEASPTEIASIAPETVMFAAGGTRRDAVLHGHDIKQFNDPMVDFAMQRFTATVGHLFKLGVKNVIAISVRSTQFAEVGAYREYLVSGMLRGIGEVALPYYEELNCRVRLIGHDGIPEFTALAEFFDTHTNQQAEHTIWWMITRSNEVTWQKVIEAAQGVKSFSEMSARYFGAAIPPVKLYISFGKVFVSPELMPLPLFGNDVHCYYYQRPGYSLSEAEIRIILYDYAYQRSTWAADKSARYVNLEQYREAWESGLIIGLGKRLGPFWYPQLPELDPSVF